MKLGATRIIVIGGSAGSPGPLAAITRSFAADFGAAIFIVVHTSATSDLPKFLAPECALQVRFAVDQEPIEPGRIYVAPLDKHLILERGRVRLQRSPKDWWYRPAINVLFRSAAAAYGSSVAAVILSGMLTDGTTGLWEVKSAGGVTIVQNPAEARCPGMPSNALENVDVDYCLPVSEIVALLPKLVGTTPENVWTGGETPARILIVEDDWAQAVNLEHQVKSLGYDVTASVGTGEEALLAARALPDLALVDIRLGGKLDGIETARILTKQFNIGVIYTTAFCDDETIRRVKSSMPYGYLGKPIRAQDLHGSIEVALSARGITAGNHEQHSEE